MTGPMCAYLKISNSQTFCFFPHPAPAALVVAFEALEVMRERAPAGEEAVYRSLISACGRCGNSEKAMAVVEVKNKTSFCC